MNAESKAIARNHYEWCKKNGRDVSWYKKPKEFEIKRGTKFADQINLYFKKRDQARGLRPTTRATSRQKKWSVRS